MCSPSLLINRSKHTIHAFIGMLFFAVLFPAVNAQDSKPELHYLVIDKSGSINSNGLQIPIRGAIVRFLAKIPENSEVRLRFFDHEVGAVQRYSSPFNTAKVGLASDWIHTNFRPKNGNTLLYGTVGKVFGEVLRDQGDFSAVNIVILTDGDNDARDLKNKAIITPFKSWADVEKLSSKLKQTKGQDWVAHLYTIHHRPNEKPAAVSGIAYSEVPKGGAIDLTPKVILVKPTADIGVHPAVAKVGQPVSLYPNSTKGIDSYQWTLSDGRKSDERNPKFTFDKAGQYDVTLNVSGQGGVDEKTARGLITIKADAPPAPPKADFVANPSEAVVGEGILFSQVSQLGTSGYKWDFGDGNSSDEAVPKHAYQKPGKYTVSLYVSGAGGKDEKTAQGLITIKADIPPEPPKADFVANPSEAVVGESILFSQVSQSGTSGYEWDFGDGNSSDEAMPKHAYEKPGKYTVSLYVTGAGGKDEKTAQGLITIKADIPPEPPKADFVANPSEAVVGEGILFSQVSQSGTSGYKWDFGDGNSSDEAVPKHVYQKPGNFTVSLSVSGAGGKDRKIKTGYINVINKPVDLAVAKFSASADSGIYPLVVKFTDESEGEIASYLWDFGDGNSSDLKNPEHSYQEAGEYSVRLSVTNTKDKVSTSADEMLIMVNAPTPAWIKWAIIGGVVLILVVVLLIKLKPAPISGRLIVDGDGDEVPQKISLEGNRFNLNELFTQDCGSEYHIVNKDGMKVIKDGAEHTTLDGRMEFKLEGKQFKYLPF